MQTLARNYATEQSSPHLVKLRLAMPGQSDRACMATVTNKYLTAPGRSPGFAFLTRGPHRVGELSLQPPRTDRVGESPHFSLMPTCQARMDHPGDGRRTKTQLPVAAIRQWVPELSDSGER